MEKSRRSISYIDDKNSPTNKSEVKKLDESILTNKDKGFGSIEEEQEQQTLETVIQGASSPFKAPVLKLNNLPDSRYESAKKQLRVYHLRTDSLVSEALNTAKERNFESSERALVSAKAKDAVLNSMRMFPNFRKRSLPNDP